MTRGTDSSCPSKGPLTTSVLAALLVAAGCASTGGEKMAQLSPPAPGAVDSLATADANRRILDAAARNRLRNQGTSPSDDYVIGSGDRTEINVFGAEALSGTFRVGEDGQIALPLLGAVQASGHSVREFEEALEARLRATYMKDPHVAVQITEMRSRGVSVLGAVRRPGVYQIPGRSTVLDVLAMAEGLAEEAGQVVLVVRGSAPEATVERLDPAHPTNAESGADLGGEVIQVHLESLLQPGNPDSNVAVLPGDVIQVRPAGMIYVVGEVNRPGGFTIPPGRPMTVLQALALAQGLGSTAAASRSVIVRTLEDGSQAETPVDLQKVLNGSAPPPALDAHDVLFVPNSGAKSFALGAVNALVRMVTLRGLVY